MSQVNPITRFIAYLPEQGDYGAEELRHTAEHARDLGLDMPQRDNFLLAVATGTPLDCHDEDCLMLDVFPGTASSARLKNADFGQAETTDQIHDVAEQSAQCYNLLRINKTSFSLESDALALKPVYIAHTRGGHVLASRITDILTLFPALAEPTDTTALYEIMTFWAPLADRTLYQKIQRTLPGGCYQWSTTSPLRKWRKRDLRPVSIDPHRLMDQTIEEIRDTAGQCLQDKTANAAEPIIMGLSGGFDSRLMAALCHERDIPVRSMNFGRRNTEEWHSARDIARALNIDMETIRFQTDTVFRHLQHQLDVMEGTADVTALSIMNFLQASLPTGTPLMHGFCGDIQCGNQTGRYTTAEYATREALADAALKSYYASTDPKLLEVFEPAIDLDQVREDMLYGLRTDCPPYQAYLLWFAENRTRRFVASQFAMLGNQFDCVLPFYDRRLFDLWATVPPLARINRDVYRKLLTTYYPALARIPHPEELTSIMPNLRSQLARYRRGLPKSLLARAIGNERARDIYLRLRRDSNIYSLSKLSAPQQQTYMFKRIEQLRPVLQNAMGISLSTGYETALSRHLQALRGVFMAAEYAKRQSERI